MPLAPSAALYLLLVGARLPYLALRSAQRLKRSGYAFPPRGPFFVRTSSDAAGAR